MIRIFFVFILLFSTVAQNFTQPNILSQELDKWASVFPNLVQVNTLTDQTTIGGNQLKFVKISFDVTNDRPVSNKLLIANLAGNDPLSTELLFNFLKTSSNFLFYPLIEQVLKQNQIFIVLVPNPDGLNRFWNGSINSVTNLNNVSLNANFPTGWNESCSGSSNPNGPNYKGPAPESEIETIALTSFLNFRKFSQVLNLKSSPTGNGFNFNYVKGCIEDSVPGTFLQTHLNIANQLKSTFSQPLNINQIPGAGSITNEALRTCGSLSYELVIDSTGQNASLVPSLSPIINQFLYNFLQMNSTFFGQVINKEATGINANIQVTDGPADIFNFVFPANYNHFGYFFLWIPEQNYTLKFTKSGFSDLLQQFIYPINDNLIVTMYQNDNFYIVVTLFPISFALFLVNFFLLVLYQVYTTIKTYNF